VKNTDGRTRTCDLGGRSSLLYPTELRPQDCLLEKIRGRINQSTTVTLINPGPLIDSLTAPFSFDFYGPAGPARYPAALTRMKRTSPSTGASSVAEAKKSTRPYFPLSQRPPVSFSSVAVKNSHAALH
jgi:hypothetical protein